MARPSRWPRVRLAAACLLFLVLAVALYLMSTPRRSPVQAWTTWAWTLRYEAFPLEDGTELEEIHATADSGSREQCVGCHGAKKDSQLPVHRIHLQSGLLPNLSCPDCHPRVDLGPRGATAIATWVDVGFCKTCHSAFPGLQSGSHMQSDDLNADCMMCHMGERAIRHAQPYLSQVIPASECKGCHGGRVLPWTPRHEQDDWLENHGPEALDAGAEHCFECHDFGLKFCDECHAEKPQSHLPEDEWKDRHPAEAQADTRACYTCHETGHCKECHVSHEEGWLVSHAAFVTERGESSCTECHSLSSCAFCHREVAGATESPPPAAGEL